MELAAGTTHSALVPFTEFFDACGSQVCFTCVGKSLNFNLLHLRELEQYFKMGKRIKRKAHVGKTADGHKLWQVGELGIKSHNTCLSNLLVHLSLRENCRTLYYL